MNDAASPWSPPPRRGEPRWNAPKNVSRRSQGGYFDVARRRSRRRIVNGKTASQPTLLDADPPTHTCQRRLLQKAWTLRLIDRLEGRIQRASSTICSSRSYGRCEFHDAVAAPLPATMIAELVGVPTEDRDRVRAWSALAWPPLEEHRATTKLRGSPRGARGVLPRPHRRTPPAHRGRRAGTRRLHHDDADGHPRRAATDRRRSPPGPPAVAHRWHRDHHAAPQQLAAPGGRGARPGDATAHPSSALRGSRGGESASRLTMLGLFRTPNLACTMRGVEIPQDAKAIVLFAAVNRGTELWDDPTRSGSQGRQRAATPLRLR